jgi:hypothetical protein
MQPKMRLVAWARASGGMEIAEVTLLPDRLLATGVIIATEPHTFRLDYALRTETGFVTASMRVTVTGEGWHRTLDLRRLAEGWSAEVKEDGDSPLEPWSGDMKALADAVHCDLGLSPLTNTLPFLREGIRDGAGPVEVTAAWISVPDLSLQPDRQRYTFAGTDNESTIVRYEAVDGSFEADIRVDADGLVIDYPGIARRVG